MSLSRAWSWILIAFAVIVGVVRATVARVTAGPTAPTWTWEMELSRAALASGIRTAVEHSDPDHWSSAGGSAPLPPSLRNLVDVTEAKAGGVLGEWTRLPDHPDGPVLLYLHGGGYVVGSPAMERPFITRLAVESGSSHVFSADYRLAPKHPFPAALEDALAAYRGVLDGGVDARRLVLVGDSAGGGLAMATMLALRDAGEPLPAGAVLVSPWVDLSNSATTWRTHEKTDYLPPMAGRPAFEYLGDTEPTDPLASPLFADLTSLPPLLIMAGGLEMILEDSTRLADRAVEAGVEVTLEIEPEMFHVWPVVVPRHPASERAFQTAAAWIGQRTG